MSIDNVAFRYYFRYFWEINGPWYLMSQAMKQIDAFTLEIKPHSGASPEKLWKIVRTNDADSVISQELSFICGVSSIWGEENIVIGWEVL